MPPSSAHLRGLDWRSVFHWHRRGAARDYSPSFDFVDLCYLVRLSLDRNAHYWKPAAEHRAVHGGCLPVAVMRLAAVRRVTSGDLRTRRQAAAYSIAAIVQCANLHWD